LNFEIPPALQGAGDLQKNEEQIFKLMAEGRA